MIEKLENSLEEGGAYVTLLTNLSKPFNGLLHEFLVTKLHVFWVSTPSFKFLYSYLTKWN